MTNVIWSLIGRIRREARRKPEVVTLRVMGQDRVFLAFDWGSDTFVLERGVWAMAERQDRDPILIVRKSVLVSGAPGFVFTLTRGNHSVAALPLLGGQFWNLGRVAPKRRTAVMTHDVVCANVVGDTIEISQRDVPTRRVVDADDWLRSMMGLALDRVVLAERTDVTLDYYRRQGQEWRIKPLAWTRKEMELALHASRARIGTCLHYHHSAKGVHFLTYPDFRQLVQHVESDYSSFVACLRELVAIPEGLKGSYMRSDKFHGHHEIELFGLRPGQAEREIIPKIEQLIEGITLNRLGREDVVAAMQHLSDVFRQSLVAPELADEASDAFVETMYKHLTGEIYYGTPDEVTPAFDDRRTALPGATYRGGRPEVHPGADDRSRAIIEYVAASLSHHEMIDYVNLYEVRGVNETTLGHGATREIVYKTNRMPLSTRLIEKRLAHTGSGYGNYMMARVQAFRCLGASFGSYHLLARHDRRSERDVHYFIRSRCPGEAFGAIPRSRFLLPSDSGGAEGAEDPETILAVAALAGDAAAQNMVLKKYIPQTRNCRFGEGKEIIEFGYDVQRMREMPLRVHLCSARGTLGWEDTAWTPANLQAVFEFYTSCYAKVIHAFWLAHRDFIRIEPLRTRFLDGFAGRIREMNWNYISRREQFDAFEPNVNPAFQFRAKWAFALWALERQARRMDIVQVLFTTKLEQLVAEHGDQP
jgi:hypothetical protein